MSNLRRGKYKILAIGANNSFTGVDPTRPSSMPVRIDGEVNIGSTSFVAVGNHPAPEPGFFRLSLGILPYTGVEDRTVIATSDEGRDVNWQIKYHDDLQGFSIAERAIWPTPAWSVTSDGEIKIELYELYPSKDQLFTFEPAYE